MIPGVPPLKVLETRTMTDDSVTTVRLPESGNIADISGYPAGSRHLVVLVNGERVDTTYAGTETAAETHDVLLRFNGDSGSNYHEQNLRGVGSSPPTSARSNDLANLRGFFVSGTANIFGGGAFLIPHAFNTYGHKVTLSVGGPSGAAVEAKVGRWASTAAITYLEILGTDEWESGSTFKLCVVDEDYAIDGAEQLLDGADAAMDTVTLPDVAGDISFIGYLRSAKAANAETWNINLNGDTTAGHYSHQVVQADASVPLAFSSTSSLDIAYQIADNETANVFGPYLGTIQQHALDDPTANDSYVLTFGGFHASATHTNIRNFSKRWNNTAAVTSLLINPVDGTAADGTMMSYYSSIPKVLLQRQTVGSGGVAAITFTLSGLTIPTNVKDLRVNWYAALEDGGAGGLFLQMRHNGDTTEANYERVLMQGAGTGENVYTSDNSYIGMTTSLDDDGANVFGGGSILIPEYAATDRHKHRLSFGGVAGLTIDVLSSRWKSTAAIATIVIEDTGSQDIAEGSIFELEGIGDAGWTGTINGVANPGKVMGVEAANIGKIMGVA